MTPTNFSIFRYYAKDYFLMAISKKRFLALAVSVIVGGSIVAACNTNSEVDGTAIPSTTTTQQATPAAAPAASTYTAPTATAATREDLFIAVLDDQGFPYGGDEDLAIEVGYSACDALDSGVSVLQLVTITLDEYTPREGGVFLGAAVGALCAENMPKLEAFQAQFGGDR